QGSPDRDREGNRRAVIVDEGLCDSQSQDASESSSRTGRRSPGQRPSIKLGEESLSVEATKQEEGPEDEGLCPCQGPPPPILVNAETTMLPSPSPSSQTSMSMVPIATQMDLPGGLVGYSDSEGGTQSPFGAIEGGVGQGRNQE
ncbi:unnamed protein product, partial [Discosporangium mesarthrocarpum]